MSNTFASLQRLFLHVADTLLPPTCHVCGATAQGVPVCADCLDELPRAGADACPVCALPSTAGLCCGECLRQPPAFDATTACFAYAFPVDSMLLALKYQYRLGLAGFFAGELGRAAGDLAGRVDVVLPMPLHPRRLAERGFNQAVEIARPLAQASGLALELTAVRRVRNTGVQAGLGRAARLRNPVGAFESSDAVKGLRVLVVDDVMTTGATLNALADCLKRQGASRVENLVVARTPLPD